MKNWQTYRYHKLYKANDPITESKLDRCVTNSEAEING